ncbi:transposase [Azospirillum sp. sgz301742]
MAARPQLVHQRPGAAQTQVRHRRGERSRRRAEKKLIEAAYTQGERLGLTVWGADEAGPFQTIPYPGQQWCPAGHPARYPHEHVRNGTAKLLTLFHPASGTVRVKGVTSCRNAVLHGWLQAELAAIVATRPAAPPAPAGAQETRASWERWQEGLAERITLRAALPPRRMLLVLDTLAGHKTPSFVCWLFDHGIMPLYTPLGGSWLNMTESVQRILKHRGLAGQHPTTVGEIIADLEAAAQGWNAAPTPFVWGGRWCLRRQRSRQRQHALGGSGACTRRPLPRPHPTVIQQWRSACQMTH